MKILRTYTELVRIPTFQERFEYLKLSGKVGEETFGVDRYLNQLFYHGGPWQEVRHEIVVRDLGHDLAMPDDVYEIFGSIFIHHMNPVSLEELLDCSDNLLIPEYLVCTSKKTHDAIHYSRTAPIPQIFIERRPGDTCPWKGVSNGR